MKNASLTAFLITIVLGSLYFIIRHYMEKDFSRRLEIRSLHVQKHDFSKHLNIISGMSLTGEYEELRKYVSCLSEQVVFEGRLSMIGCPALSVLLEDKKFQAEENLTSFILEIDANIENIRITPTELCTVIGNIVDNGLEAASTLPPGQRKISIGIGCKNNLYSFKISNTGKSLLERDIDKIFHAGYSTKSEGEGHGMGLYIVKRIIRKNHGRIEVRSENGITTFTVFFPF